MNEGKRYQGIFYLVDESTGEVIEEVRDSYEVPESEEDFDYIDWVEKQLQEKGKGALPQELRPSQKIIDERHQRIKENAGPFVWVKFEWGQPFLPKVDPSTLARAFYVGSHVNGFGDCDLTKLQLGSCLFDAKKKIKASGLFTGKLDPENIDRKVMWCGRFKSNPGDGIGKLFRLPYQWSMEHTAPKRQEGIGLILKLLPYTHQITNIISTEPTNDGCAHPMTQQQIAKVLGKSPANASRLVKWLGELRFEKNARQMPIFYRARYADKNVYCIHPEFWYASDLLERNDLCVPKWYL